MTRKDPWFKDKTVLVVGGTGTLGRKIAAKIVMRCPATVTLSRRAGMPAPLGGVRHMSCDITDADALARCMQLLETGCPPLGAVINCAGCNILRAADRYSPPELREIIDVNLYGAMLVARYAVPLLKRAGGGKLINVASQAGLDPQVQNTAYSAAKGGVIALGKGLARELAPNGIAVLTLSPGEIESPMMNRAMADFSTANQTSPSVVRQQICDKIPAGRFGDPEEIADIVLQLLCVETMFLTGTTIVAAGGRTCH